MKKFLLVAVAAVSASLVSNAQIKKGTVLLGGGLSFGKSLNADPTDQLRDRYVYLNPNIGFATKDNKAIGINLRYARSRTKFAVPGSKREFDSYGVGFFQRNYLPLGKSFYLFGEAGLNYSYSKSENGGSIGSSYSNTDQSVSAVFYPGITYVVNNRFHLEIGINNLVNLSYSKSETKYNTSSGISTSKSTGFSVTTNAGNSNPLSVGFRIALGKRK